MSLSIDTVLYITIDSVYIYITIYIYIYTQYSLSNIEWILYYFLHTYFYICSLFHFIILIYICVF